MPRFILTVLAVMLVNGNIHANPMFTYDTFLGTTVYYGTARLYSPGGMLLSTTTAMTVETQEDIYPLADRLYFMPLMGNSVATQISVDGNVPAVFQNLFSFVDNYGFGVPIPLVLPYVPPAPNSNPTPSAQQLTTQLLTQPAPFNITGDTGFVETGNTFDFAYFWGLFGPLPSSPPGIDNYIEGVTNVIFYRRDIQVTETAPEPGGCGALGLALIVAWQARKRQRNSNSI